MAFFGQHFLDHQLVDLVVLDDQNIERGQSLGRIRGRFAKQLWRRCGGQDRHGQAEPEKATVAELTLHSDRAFHRIDKAPRDAKAKAGAAEFARIGRIERDEVVEDFLELVFGDADAGVDDTEFKDVAVAQTLRFDADHSFAGELDRVGS